MSNHSWLNDFLRRHERVANLDADGSGSVDYVPHANPIVIADPPPVQSTRRGRVAGAALAAAAISIWVAVYYNGLL